MKAAEDELVYAALDAVSNPCEVPPVIIKMTEVEPGYWADPEARFIIERAASSSDVEVFRLADMHTSWRDEVSSLSDALKVMAKVAGSPFSV